MHFVQKFSPALHMDLSASTTLAPVCFKPTTIYISPEVHKRDKYQCPLIIKLYHMYIKVGISILLVVDKQFEGVWPYLCTIVVAGVMLV